MADQLLGADVSQFNAVNMQQLKNDGKQFVQIRAGYGGGGKDSLFNSHWADAKAVGLVRQAYHFAYPGRSSGSQQAHDFFDTVKAQGLQVGDGFMLDMEDEVVYGRRLVASDVQWALDFLNTLKDLSGVKGEVYLNSDLKGRFDWSPVKNADYGLHIANYGANNGSMGTAPDPAPWSFWALWQYTSKGNAGGVSPLDLDVFSGNLDALKKYGIQNPNMVQTPAPVEQHQPAAPTVSSQTYTVKSGDNLSSIAAGLHTTWQALASLNRLANPNLIYAGQVLQVGSVSAQARTYTVVKNDNLSVIAGKTGSTVATLVSLNGISNPNLIFPGQVLKY